MELELVIGGTKLGIPVAVLLSFFARLVPINHHPLHSRREIPEIRLNQTDRFENPSHQIQFLN